MQSSTRLRPALGNALRNVIRWHRLISLSAVTLLYTSAFPSVVGAVARHQAVPPDEPGVEFVVGVCTSAGDVRGNFEADVKPLDGVNPLDLAQPWFGENGPEVSGRLPAGCEPGGSGFVLEVARDTGHKTGEIGLVTGVDGRASGPLTALPHADRLASGNEIWARPINADPSRYQAIAFRCGDDARNGDLNEYISGTHPDVQHCVAYYVRRPTPAAPPSSTPVTTTSASTIPTPSTTAPPLTTTTPAPTTQPSTTTSSTTTGSTTTAPAASGPAVTSGSQASPAVPDRSSTSDASGSSTDARPSPSTTDLDDRRDEVGSATTQRPSIDDTEASTSTNGRPLDQPAISGAVGADTPTTPSATTNPTSTPFEGSPSRPESTIGTTAGEGSETADSETRTSAVPVTRPEPAPTTTDPDESIGGRSDEGGNSGSGEGAGSGTAVLARPGAADDVAIDSADAGDSETALAAPGPRRVDLTLAIEVRGLTRTSDNAADSPWTNTVRAEVQCGGGPPKTLILEPGEDPGFRLSLGMQLPVTDTVSCTHRLIDDGLDDGSLGGVIASVDGEQTRRGDVQTLVLEPNDPARTLQYELVFVDAGEASELVASGNDLSRIGSGVADEAGSVREVGADGIPAGTGERIPAPTLVALGMMFIVGLALSIAQSKAA